MSDVVRNLRAYHMIDDEGNEETMAPVIPLPKPPPYRMVPLSEAEAEALEYLGQGLCQLGAEKTGAMCKRLAASWQVAS